MPSRGSGPITGSAGAGAARSPGWRACPTLLYLRVYRLADTLGLDDYEAAFWSGMTYMLIMPVQLVNGRLMRTPIQAAATSAREPAAS